MSPMSPEMARFVCHGSDADWAAFRAAVRRRDMDEARAILTRSLAALTDTHPGGRDD